MKKFFILSSIIYTVFIIISCDIGYFFDSLNSNDSQLSERDAELIFIQADMRKKEKSGKLVLNENYFRFDGCSGFYFTEGTTAYLGFFGADEIADFHNSTYAEMSSAPFFSDPESRVHSGFLMAYEGCSELVENWALQQQENGIHDFVILGHSMGGALALLYSASLNELLEPDSEIYCFTTANPKCFNRTSAEEFSSKIQCRRIVNGTDQVPSLPYSELGFVHVGEYTHIGDDPNGFLGSTSIWIYQHFIDNYAKTVNEMGYKSKRYP